MQKKQIWRPVRNWRTSVLICGWGDDMSDEHEPITEDWLIAAGLLGTVDMGGSFWFRIYPHLGSCQIGCTNHQEFYGWDEELDLPPVKTRGDVRRVCKALGIQIKGDSDD
jgi:hypothetical protein